MRFQGYWRRVSLNVSEIAWGVSGVHLSKRTVIPATVGWVECADAVGEIFLNLGDLGIKGGKP